jgi:hypothetical protein
MFLNFLNKEITEAQKQKNKKHIPDGEHVCSTLTATHQACFNTAPMLMVLIADQ